MGKSEKRQAEASASKPAKKKEEVEKKDEDKMSDDEIEFEDPYEDEFEEEEIIENDDEDEGEEAEEYYEQMRDGEIGALTIGEADIDEDDDEVDEKDKKVWKPGDNLEEGEELDYDPSTYTMLHAMGTQWPCLSFGFFSRWIGRSKNQVSPYLVHGSGHTSR